MLSNTELIERFMEKVSDKIALDLKQSIAQALEKEIRQNISRALMQGEFYRTMNSELQEGLKTIYKEVAQAKSNGERGAGSSDEGERTSVLISEASNQLDEILKSTEQAAVEVMDIVERQMDAQADAALILAKVQEGTAEAKDVSALIDANQGLNEDLLRIMTALSFQDLTGQRIKKIIAAINQIERITLDLFLATGLKIKGLDEDPDRDMQTLENETKRKMSELKGPQTETSQKDVDDLLAQLGM